MKGLSPWVLLVAAAVGMAVIARSGAITLTNDNQQTMNAVFRDGAYLGKLAAERGESPHIASGRWARTAGGVENLLAARARRVGDRGPGHQVVYAQASAALLERAINYPRASLPAAVPKIRSVNTPSMKAANDRRRYWWAWDSAGVS